MAIWIRVSALVRCCGQQVKGDSFLFSGRLEGNAEVHSQFGSALRMEHAILGDGTTWSSSAILLAIPALLCRSTVTDPTRDYIDQPVGQSAGHYGISNLRTSQRPGGPEQLGSPRGLCLCVGFEHSHSRRRRNLLRVKRCNQFQSPGPAFGNSNPIRFSVDHFQTRLATLADPFRADSQRRRVTPMESWPCGVMTTTILWE